MTRVLATAAALLMALPLASIPVDAAAAPGPWWPSPESGPDDFRSLWNLRVPMRVDNPGTATLPVGQPVQAHLDLGALLAESGWPASGGTLKSFRLDSDSLRLVETTANWLNVRAERPLAVSTTWFEPTQDRFGKAQDEPFHPQRNAIVTLEWRLATAVPSGQAAYFHLYFETLQNSDRPAAAPSQAEREGLEALHWISPGTRLHGYHPGSSTPVPTLIIIATEDDTKVSVLAHRGSPQPLLDNRPGSGNPTSPFTVDAGRVVRYSLGSAATGFVVAADKPVVVANHSPAVAATGEFVPALDGTLRGGRFLLPAIPSELRIIAPSDLAGRVQVCHGLAGAAPVCENLQPGTESRPMIPQPLPGQQQNDLTRVYEVRADAPVLVQYSPRQGAGFQVPSTHGSPVGDRFLAATIRSTQGGYTVRSWHEAADLDVAYDRFLDPPSPVRPVVSTEAPWVQLAIAGTDLPALDTSASHTPVLLVRRVGADPGGLLGVQGGERGDPEVDQATAFGGRRGLDFVVTGPFGVMSQYDTTLLSTGAPGAVPQTTQMEQDTFQEFPADRMQVTRITADKPVSVLPLGDPGSYLRFLPARPAAVVPAILPADYRGYLVDIEPEGGAEPLFFNGKPGQTIEIPFRVRNLARWSDGRSLPDTVHLSATVTPDSFPGSITFPQPALDLASAAPASASVRVALPPDLPPDTSVTLAIRATSENNPQMWAEFTAIVFSRQTYGVEMWWGEPTSSARPSVLPLRLLPGASQDLPFVAKNTGSGEDAIDITLGALPPGWTAQVLRNGLPVGDRTPVLEADQALRLALRVRASETAQVGAITLPVDGASVASPATVDRLLLNARLALGQSIELTSDAPVLPIEPGGAANFTALLSNVGKDSVSLAIGMRNSLPAGWSAAIQGVAAAGSGVVTLLPGQTLPIPVRVAAPATAAANVIGAVVVEARGTGDAASLQAALSLATVVAGRHAVTLTAPQLLQVVPGANHTIPLALSNGGNGNETIRLAAESAPGSWSLAPPAPVELGANRTATPAIGLRVPADFPAGVSTIRILASGAAGPLASAEVAVQVAELHRLGWSGNATPLRIPPGEQVAHPLRLANLGNMPELVTLEVVSPSGWAASSAGAAFELARGASRTLDLSFTVPPDAAGSFRIEAIARLASDPTPARAVLDVLVERPGLEVRDIQVIGQARRAGDVVLVAARFANPSQVPLREAEVLLRVGNTTLDSVRFDSIGAGSNVTAVLRWIVEDAQAAPRISWGTTPADGFEEMGSAPVEAASAEPRPAPALAPALALLALALAAAGRRRRLA